MTRTMGALMFVATIFLTRPTSGQESLPENLVFETNAVLDGDAPVQPVRLSARLYMPSVTAGGQVAAMVILNNSGGVLSHVEVHYARQLAENGVAGLVVDSFGPRGVRSTVDDQTRVSTWQMENDAFAALAILKQDRRIDPRRIGVMGVSKGGVVAMQAAMTVRQAWRHTGDLAFALHVPIVPDCHIQQRTSATTGAPMLLMLAELDDYTLAKPCVEYSERIRASGNKNISVIVYPRAHHGWEWSVLEELPTAVKLVCTALIEDDGAFTFPEHGKTVRGPAISAFMDEVRCFARGAHVGGGSDALKRQATADLIGFLKANGF